MTEQQTDPEWEAAQKKLKRRLGSMMLVCVMLAVPVAICTWRLFSVYGNMHQQEDWARAQLAKPDPNPQAYSILGADYLSKGEIAKSLPLLRRAAAEGPKRNSVLTYCYLAEADLRGMQSGVSTTSKAEALRALGQAESMAKAMPRGGAAATYYEIGRLDAQLGDLQGAVRNLTQARDLQRDDWVELGDGRRYRQPGVADLYAKQLGAAQEALDQSRLKRPAAAGNP